MTISQSSGALPYGVLLRGSRVALDGILSTTGLNTGAIGIFSGEFVGNATGAQLVAKNNAYPCIYIPNGPNGSPAVTGGPATSGSPVFIYSANPTTSPNDPIFTTVQLGYQPLIGDTTNTPQLASETAAASYLSSANNNDPIVYNDVATSTEAATGQNVGYLDPVTFERGVRNIVNLETLAGVRLNYLGTCHS